MDVGPCVYSRLQRFTTPPSCLGVKSGSSFFGLLPCSPHCWQWVACGATLQPHHSDRGNSGIPSMLQIVLSSADVTAALLFTAAWAQWQQSCVGYIWPGRETHTGKWVTLQRSLSKLHSWNWIPSKSVVENTFAVLLNYYIMIAKHCDCFTAKRGQVTARSCAKRPWPLCSLPDYVLYKYWPPK